jgi:hypothetical protein
MRLQADDAVHHLRAHGLQALGPVDVGLFVEARLQLHHGHHFLAAPRGLDQQVHQHRLAAGAVDGLLDRQHVRVETASRRNCTTGSKLSKGWCSSTSPLARRSKIERWRGRRSRAARPARVGSKRSCGASALVDQLVQAHQVDRPVDAVERRVGHRELLQQKLRQLGRAGVDHLEADRAAEVARGQPRAQRVAQVDDVLLVHVQIGVARHAELREGLDLAALGTAPAGAHGSRWSAARRPAGPSLTASGRRITRGSTRGTLTMAIELSRPKASLPPAAR